MFAPSLYVIDLPYLFRTNQEGWAILDKYWDELNAKTIKESGNRIIGWLDLGYRHVCKMCIRDRSRSEALSPCT